MVRQTSEGRRVPPGRNPSAGAAVLDREEDALNHLGVGEAAALLATSTFLPAFVTDPPHAANDRKKSNIAVNFMQKPR